MKRAVFVTSHYFESDRKAGFHWLAEAMWRAGWHVLFFTESVSWLSLLRRDPRCKYPLFRERHRLRQVRERLSSYVWLTPYHPINLRAGLLNRMSAGLLKRYADFSFSEAEPEIARADLFVFDSDHGLFLFDRFKRLNPGARFVYRASDDVCMMRHHPILPAHEADIVARFDMISAPAGYIRHRFPHLRNAFLQNHGLEKALFDHSYPNPYGTPPPNVIYVGKHYFDADFMARAVRSFPSWSFHVFGAIGRMPAAANLTCYGERRFDELVPYLQHADIGLQNLAYVPGAEWFGDSLKMFQYTYCKLPIVAPNFLRTDRPHVVNYEPGDDASVCKALQTARTYDRSSISTAGILTWDELAAKLAGEEIACRAA